jgi:hypothetical protein
MALFVSNAEIAVRTLPDPILIHVPKTSFVFTGARTCLLLLIV